jgi:hypothetical protein
MSKKIKTLGSKIARGNSAQFFVAGELCRRNLVAVVTMGNTPNTDILCSNNEGTKFVHIQVKTYKPGNNGVIVGLKAEKNFGKNFVWVLAGIPKVDIKKDFEFFIIPSTILSKNVTEGHKLWLNTVGKKGRIRNDSTMRVIRLPPKVSATGWSVEEFKNRWDIIEDLLQ